MGYLPRSHLLLFLYLISEINSKCTRTAEIASRRDSSIKKLERVACHEFRLLLRTPLYAASGRNVASLGIHDEVDMTVD